MNLNRGEAPGNFELPPRPASPEVEAKQEQAVETPAARPETSGSRPSQPGLPVAPQDIPAADQPAIGDPTQDVAAPPAAGGLPGTQDSDHIEKEWIDKVKNVVASTREDPYKQKDEVSRVKADYIKKRFNKQIKTDEAAA